MGPGKRAQLAAQGSQGTGAVAAAAAHLSSGILCLPHWPVAHGLPEPISGLFDCVLQDPVIDPVVFGLQGPVAGLIEGEFMDLIPGSAASGCPVLILGPVPP